MVPIKIWASFGVMLVSIVLGLILSFSYGLILDKMHDQMIEVGVFDVPFEWSSLGMVDYLVGLVYLCCYIIPIMGVTFFIITAVFRQQYDVEEDWEEEYFY